MSSGIERELRMDEHKEKKVFPVELTLSFIKRTASIWHKIVNEYNMKGDIKTLTWPDLDPSFIPGIITAICTVTQGNEFRSFKLENEDFYRYLQLRDYYERKIKPGMSEEGSAVMDIVTDIKKVISRSY